MEEQIQQQPKLSGAEKNDNMVAKSKIIGYFIFGILITGVNLYDLFFGDYGMLEPVLFGSFFVGFLFLGRAFSSLLNNYYKTKNLKQKIIVKIIPIIIVIIFLVILFFYLF